MATPVWFSGFEGWPDTPNANGAGLANSFNGGTFSVSTAQAHTGARSLRFNPAATNCWIGLTLSSPTIIVVRLYLYFAALPTSDSVLFFGHVSAGLPLRIDFNFANSRIDASVGGGGTQTGMTITTGTWYRVEARMNCANGGNSTIDWGVAAGDASLTNYTQVSVAQTNTTFLALRLGTTASESFDMYMDDVFVSVTSGDYPIGPGGTERLAPTADGTHNAGTNVIEDNAGTDIGTTTAYDKLNSVPPSSTAYIKQVANGTGNYAEIQFGNITATHAAILAARAYL
ncbi:MAG TPA: hypothetical protein VFY83_15140, partial [Anaerolineales bacterium]|nr:hypothetical protein [Anaerolineales bacterium]